MYFLYIPTVNKESLKEFEANSKSDISHTLEISRHTLYNWLKNKDKLTFSKLEKLNGVLKYTLSSIIVSDEDDSWEAVRLKGQHRWRYNFRNFLQHVLDKLECAERTELNSRLKKHGVSISRQLYSYLCDSDRYMEEITNLMKAQLFVDLCNICHLYPGEYVSDGMGEITPEPCQLHPNLRKAYIEEKERAAHIAREVDVQKGIIESLEADKTNLQNDYTANKRELEISWKAMERCISTIKDGYRLVIRFTSEILTQLDEALANKDITELEYNSIKRTILTFESKYKDITSNN